jgi:hypothetical protein
MSTYIDLLSFIYSIKSRFFTNLGVAVAEVSVHGRVVTAAEEEASIEAEAKETGLSDVDGCGGDRWSRERWRGDRRGLRVLR